jgi:Ca2+-transporting ATPase
VPGAQWWVSAVAAVILGITLAWEPARGLFRFGPLHGHDLAVALGSAAGLVLVLEILKRFWRGSLTA